MPRARRRTPAATGSAHLFLLDATAVVERLRARQSEMVRQFSTQRTRDALLEPLASWAESARFEDLAALTPRQREAVVAFMERLRALRWYLRFTEHMPTQLEQVLSSHVALLNAAYTELDAGLKPGRSRSSARRR